MEKAVRLFEVICILPRRDKLRFEQIGFRQLASALRYLSFSRKILRFNLLRELLRCAQTLDRVCILP